MNTRNYHTSTHANVWESMGNPCNCKKLMKAVFFTTSHVRIRIRYCKSRENLYQELQVTCMCRACNEIEGLHDKIIVPSCTGKNIKRLTN